MLLLSSFLLLLADDFIKTQVSSESTDVINTTLGPVRGEILKTISKGLSYSSFKGIRFGKPPIGSLRFKPSNFAEPWTEVMDANVKGPGCAQLVEEKVSAGDEDCLFVNVFSPVSDLAENRDELKAVIVWIYGGAYVRGSSDPDFYGPDFLIENDVVVVTFDYRLGPLGFLALNHRDATGNAGLKDQQLLLKWVRLNVEKFHGDPTRVTIFGESVGAVCALYHTLSDQSQGLFQNVIAVSGTPMHPWGFVESSKAKRKAIELATLLGQNTTDKEEELLATFHNASAYDLMYYASQLGEIDPPFGPVLEDSSVSSDSTAFLSTCILNKYESGNFSQVPLLLGFMKDETLSLTRKVFMTQVTSEAKIVAKITNTSFAIPSVYSVKDGEWTWSWVEETSDLLFKAGIELTQRYVTARSTQPLYYFRLTFAPLQNSFHQLLFKVPVVGAGHADSVAYTWWMSDGTFPLDPEDPISIARERMTRMWTNFAKCGNPTPDGTNDPLLNITWPDYASSKNHLDFGFDLTLGGLNFNKNTENIIEASEPFLAEMKDC